MHVSDKKIAKINKNLNILAKNLSMGYEKDGFAFLIDGFELSRGKNYSIANNVLLSKPRGIRLQRMLHT